MKIVVASVAVVATGIAFAAGTAIGGAAPNSIAAVAASTESSVSTHLPAVSMGARGVSNAALTAVVQRYCAGCHGPDTLTRKGNLTLTGFEVESALTHRGTAELMIRKLRADMMPPPGARRPTGDSLLALVETLENILDKATPPTAGYRTFQRMNRREYEASIRDLLSLEVDAGDWLPLDQMSANFDNIADVQALSPTLLDAYLTAAGAVSRMAVGDRKTPSLVASYKNSPLSSQHPWERVEGTPIGTRGGMVFTHTFPADGNYQFRIDVGGGVGTRFEDLDVSVNGRRVALLHYERRMESSASSADDFLGADYVRTEFLPLTAGQHRISVAFVRRTEGPYEDLVKPNGWSQASNGSASAGSTEPPKVRTVAIIGPNQVTGISDNPGRKAVFSCKPAAAAQERSCAERIVSTLGRRAYRRTLTQRELESLMSIYDKGAADDGFEEGVRLSLQAILASPRFVFRIEAPPPANAQPGQDYLISDVDLATRLSFFLWGSIPDDELLTLAEQKKLSDRRTLERQVKRMLEDPRTPAALANRFAEQWLRLQDLDKVHPDAFFYPDYSARIADLMRRETLEFFQDMVRNDRSLMELLTAKHSFMNEQLARFYGIPNVSGETFRRVEYPDDTRRGIFGHGSYLVQTSYGNRTSPVLRGKYVMEVLIGAPPPPPPPFVPDLEQAPASEEGRQLTTRERMAVHARNPTCNACHQYIDPIGLAVDNFDVTGRYRYRENLMPLDTRGMMYDGTPVSSAAELSAALVKRPIPLARTFAENMMAYATGRRMEDADQTIVRSIAKSSASSNYRLSSFIMGVVMSQPFRYRQAGPVAADDSRER